MDRNNFSRLHYNIRFMVALRKESVDRNILSKSAMVPSLMSLSARRAWIEIPHAAYAGNTLLGRSPQGERG